MISAPPQIDVLPLLGRAWATADCAQLVRAALARGGIHVPDYAFARFGRDDAAALGAYLAMTEPLWLELGTTEAAATEAGDVIVSGGPAGEVHLAVLIEPLRRMALTTSRGTGAHCLRADRIQRVVRVLRWRR